MPLIHALVLGVVQGVSEFWPISSSAHLHITRWLLGWDELTGSAATSFDTAVHVGTLTGAVAYLHRDVRRYGAAVLTSLKGVLTSLKGRANLWGRASLRVNLREQRNLAERINLGEQRNLAEQAKGGKCDACDVRCDARIGWALTLSALPAALAGILLGDVLAVSSLQESERMLRIALALIIFGIILGWADRHADRHADRSVDRRSQSQNSPPPNSPLHVEDFSFKPAIILGLAQILALHPGVSRSGVTLTVARVFGFAREDAVRLVFLMGLPIIAGAGVYGTIGLQVPFALWPAMACGAFAASVTGWVAVWITVQIAMRLDLKVFVMYRVVLGLAILLALALA